MKASNKFWLVASVSVNTLGFPLTLYKGNTGKCRDSNSNFNAAYASKSFSYSEILVYCSTTKRLIKDLIGSRNYFCRKRFKAFSSDIF